MTSTNVSRRIVVGVDFTETGDEAAREAVRLARDHAGTELHVTYVIATPPMPDTRVLAEIGAKLPERMLELREHFARVGAPRGGAKFSMETVFHVRLGDPGQALHQVAVDVDADLIVVGTHGRRGVEKMLLGSVAEQLVRGARLPVLVARPKEIERLPKSERPEPPRPGEDLSNHGLTDRVHLEFVPRTSHISGLV